MKRREKKVVLWPKPKIVAWGIKYKRVPRMWFFDTYSEARRFSHLPRNLCAFRIVPLYEHATHPTKTP